MLPGRSSCAGGRPRLYPQEDRTAREIFLDPAWTWVRPDAAAHIEGGSRAWPTEASDLVGTANTAGVLLRDAPAGDYVAETKVILDLGTDTVRNYEQAASRHASASSRRAATTRRSQRASTTSASTAETCPDPASTMSVPAGELHA